MCKIKKEKADCIVQIRTTSEFKACLLYEAAKRTTTMSKLLQNAFWAFLETEGSILDK